MSLPKTLNGKIVLQVYLLDNSYKRVARSRRRRALAFASAAAAAAAAAAASARSPHLSPAGPC